MFGIEPTLFASTFLLILLAELPDKTIFATLVLATRSQPWAIFAGVALAFLVQTCVAVVFGKFFAILPEHVVHVISGLLFLLFAVITWRKREEDAKSETDKEGKAAQNGESFFKAAASAFLVIFIAEWGDLTQLATATLIAKYPGAVPTIFVSAVLALWCATALAILIGNRAKQWIKPVLMQKIAAIAFGLVGSVILIRG